MESEGPDDTAIALRPGQALRVRGTTGARFYRPIALPVTAGALAGVTIASLGLSSAFLPLLYLPLLPATLSRAQIRRWVRRLSDPAQQSSAEQALLTAAGRPWFLRGDRLDGLGELLLHRLERGDLGGATELVMLRPADASRPRRARTRDHGHVGEVVFSLFGWLVPGQEALALDTTTFRPATVDWEDRAHGMDPALAQLIGLHATAQCLAQAQLERAIVEWNGIDRGALRRDRPVLYALVLAALARARPADRDALHVALTSMSAPQRELVVRMYPEWASAAEGAPYRLPAVRGLGDDARMPALIDARGGLTLWERCFPARAKGLNVMTSLAGAATLIPALTLVARQPAVAAVFLLLSFGLMILPWIVADGRRQRRLAPLQAAGITSPSRVAELRRTATRFHASADVGDQMPWDAAELLLFTTLHRTEQCIADDDLTGAAELLRPRLVDPAAFLSPMPYGSAIASSWIRTTAIVGRVTERPPMQWGFLDDPRPAGKGLLRSGHSDHPAALALARSLEHALAPCWPAAADTFTDAARGIAEITLDEGERRIYGELARSLHARGVEIPAPLRTLLDAPPVPGLAQLLSDRSLTAAGARAGR